MYFMTKALDEYTGMGLMSIRRGSWRDVGSFALVLLVYSFLLRSMGGNRVLPHLDHWVEKNSLDVCRAI